MGQPDEFWSLAWLRHALPASAGGGRALPGLSLLPLLEPAGAAPLPLAAALQPCPCDSSDVSSSSGVGGDDALPAGEPWQQAGDVGKGDEYDDGCGHEGSKEWEDDEGSKKQEQQREAAAVERDEMRREWADAFDRAEASTGADGCADKNVDCLYWCSPIGCRDVGCRLLHGHTFLFQARKCREQRRDEQRRVWLLFTGGGGGRGSGHGDGSESNAALQQLHEWLAQGGGSQE